MRNVTLYLDFDGVLHHSAVYRCEITGAPYVNETEAGHGRTIFDRVKLLESVLDDFADVKIVLSTSWVDVFGSAGALERLRKASPKLAARVVGSTTDGAWRAERLWPNLTRFQQIAQHADRHSGPWLAIDDDMYGWPPFLRDRIIDTADEGFTEADALRLRESLLSLTERLAFA
jgi:hypothetical protein